jgi:hypothetical protein
MAYHILNILLITFIRVGNKNMIGCFYDTLRSVNIIVFSPSRLSTDIGLMLELSWAESGVAKRFRWRSCARRDSESAAQYRFAVKNQLLYICA